MMKDYNWLDEWYVSNIEAFNNLTIGRVYRALDKQTPVGERHILDDKGSEWYALTSTGGNWRKATYKEVYNSFIEHGATDVEHGGIPKSFYFNEVHKMAFPEQYINNLEGSPHARAKRSGVEYITMHSEYVKCIKATGIVQVDHVEDVDADTDTKYDPVYWAACDECGELVENVAPIAEAVAPSASESCTSVYTDNVKEGGANSIFGTFTGSECREYRGGIIIDTGKERQEAKTRSYAIAYGGQVMEECYKMDAVASADFTSLENRILNNINGETKMLKIKNDMRIYDGTNRDGVSVTRYNSEELLLLISYEKERISTLQDAGIKSTYVQKRVKKHNANIAKLIKFLDA